jgi:hypothetical protein
MTRHCNVFQRRLTLHVAETRLECSLYSRISDRLQRLGLHKLPAVFLREVNDKSGSRAL